MKNTKHKTRKFKPQDKTSIPPSVKSKLVDNGKTNRVISIFLFVFAFMLYANTLNHSYVLDDDVVYLKNKDVQAGIKGIPDILHHSFIYGFTGHNDQSYRPLVLIIFSIEKESFGNNPHTGHLINVLLYALATVLFYKLLQKIFPMPVQGSPVLKGLGIHTIPFLAALLFAAHPIHTEAVANIKGRDDILNFIFFALSLIYLLRYVDEQKKQNLFFSILYFFLCLLCKEMAVTFLAIYPLVIFFFRKVRFKQIAITIFPFIVVFGLYMLIRSSVLDVVTFQEKMQVVNNGLAAATNNADRIATAIFILGKYIFLLFFPFSLSWDYSFNQIPIVSFADLKVIGVFCLFLALGIYSLMVVRERIKNLSLKSEKRNSIFASQISPIFTFCILFFFITMSVVSNIFIMIGSTLGERFLFVPSFAFCMAAPFLLNKFGKNVLWIGIPIIVVLFSIKTVTRNKDWKDNFSLFSSGVQTSPNSSRAESALGSAYREMAEKEQNPAKRAELFKQAITYYKKAIEILPDNIEALYNAGVSYYAMGNKEVALKEYEKALKVTPEYANAANNAGVIYFERQDYENAKKYFLQAVQYNTNNSDALGNLGAIFHNQGKMQKAIDYYKKALQINPSNRNVQNNLARAEATIRKVQ